MSVKLAYNTGDATSAKTLGIVSDASIAANGTGTITLVGVVDGLTLGAYSEGDQLYLGATAGSLTSTKPYAPNHLVYVGIVERANNGNGELYVRVQNGYELNELHDVQITTPPSAGALLVYDATNALWKAARLTAGTNIAITNADASVTVGITGTIALGNGGTGQTTAQAAINSLAGSTTSGYFLRGNGTNVVMAAISAGDVPTLNQNTTGSAATLTTPRAIYGNNFDGSAALTQAIAGTYGGTGVNNGANTITIAGNVTHAGAFTQTFTATANTSLTLPVTGTLATLAGSEALSNKTITASAFNGTVGATTPSTVAATTITGTTSLRIGTASSFGGAVGQLNGANVAQANGVGMVSIASTDAVAADKGGSLALGAKATGGAETNPYPMAVISGRAVNATDLSGYFAVATSDASGTIAERLRLTSTGLAVTGALSSTGAISSTLTGNDITPFSLLDSTLANGNFTQILLGKATNSNECAVIKFTQNATTSVLGFQMFGDGSPGLTISKGASGIAAISSTGLALTGQYNGVFSGGGAGINVRNSSDTSGAFFLAFQKADNTTIGSITRVTTTDAVAYNTTSDGRLKENLRDFTDSGRLIDSLKPRVFDWKNSDENGKNVLGFIAQEEHAADPIFAHIGAVSVGDEDPETITKQWQRSDSALIPILVAELKALRQRVAALESN